MSYDEVRGGQKCHVNHGDLILRVPDYTVTNLGLSCAVFVLTCFVMCVLVICVLVFTVFCILCTVFFVLFRLCIFIFICFVCTSVRTIATE